MLHVTRAPKHGSLFCHYQVCSSYLVFQLHYLFSTVSNEALVLAPTNTIHSRRETRSEQNTSDMMQRQAGDEESTIQHPLLDTLHSEEEEDLPEVSLGPYKSYAKYFWQCSKWVLLLCLFDAIARIIWEESRHEPWRVYWEAVAWIVNAVFFFLAARAVDRDVFKVDEEVQSETQSGNENPQIDWDNYDHIYGRVARRIDVWLTSACRPHRVSMRERPSATTSFVSHMCWIAWAICFASAYSKTLESLFGSINQEVPEGIPTNTSSTFSNISHLSQSLQSWIVDYPSTMRRDQ